MKNILILGLVAALLFSVSATLSVWLYHPNTPAATGAGEGESAKAAKKPLAAKTKTHDEPEAEAPRPAVRAKPHAGTEDAAHLAAQHAEHMAALKEREARLERRQGQLDLVMQDVRNERASLENLRKQVSAELKQLTEKVSELEQLRQTGAKTAAEAKSRQIEIDESERKNMDRLASMYDSMPAENAARIIGQMADMGKLDTAAKLLAQMKERQAAKVLAEIPDPTLAAQLLEKMRVLRRTTTPASTPAPTP